MLDDQALLPRNQGYSGMLETRPCLMIGDAVKTVDKDLHSRFSNALERFVGRLWMLLRKV